jgi:hypothetical protein
MLAYNVLPQADTRTLVSRYLEYSSEGPSGVALFKLFQQFKLKPYQLDEFIGMHCPISKTISHLKVYYAERRIGKTFIHFLYPILIFVTSLISVILRKLMVYRLSRLHELQ